MTVDLLLILFFGVVAALALLLSIRRGKRCKPRDPGVTRLDDGGDSDGGPGPK